jgi:hypothetical protein
MSDVDLIINVHTNGVKDITNLSAATRALALNLRGITVPMSKLDAHSRAVNKALGMTNRSMNDHAKTAKQMIANQKALGAETKRVQSNIKSYAMAIQSAGGTTTALGRELIQSRSELKQFSSTLRGLRIRAFGSDLSSISLKLQRIGKDAQFVGRSLMINLTAPILLFARMGFQSLLKVDEQFVRLTKVLEGVAMTTDQANSKLKDYLGPDKEKRVKEMTDSFRDLNTALTEQSTKFGVAKDLVISLAVDFAELGITANENIVALTELALAAEKLGGMDASGAQDLSSALFFNATRAYEVAGAFDSVTSAAERESKAIASARVQLNMFNTIENVTALSLKDLADSLPEVGGMALSFGLSMTEAAALLAPMKAAGFEIGASANSIKVSLQRAIVPTKKNVELLARLSKQYGATGKAGMAFSESTKTGLTGLQAIVDIFAKVVEGGRNTEAGLKLMSEIFEKRQGPRMYVAIEQLNQFDAALKNVNNNQSPERLMAGVAENSIIAFNKLNGTTLPETISQFSDIGVIARIAGSEVGALVDGFKGKGVGGSITEIEKKGAIEARKAVALLIKEKRLNEDIDLISEVRTQAGRAMLIELAGASGAADVANMELEQSLKSLSVATQRIKIAFKNFAADILRNVAPSIKKLSDTINNLYLKWQALSDTTRERISKLILGFLGFLAVMAPVILALGTMQSSIGVLGRAATFFLPKLKNFEGGLVGIAGGAKKATTAMTDMYNSFLGKKQPLAILPSFLSSGGSAPLEGMIGMPKRSGTNIRLPGNIAPTPDSLFDADGNPLTGRARAAVITKNRTARLSHAARGRGAVDQYLRNEASMLSANDMRLNARGRVIGARGGFIGRDILGEISKASVLRESMLTDAGISRTGAGGARLATKRGLVDISESRALRIARGGIGGAVARRTAALPGLADSFTSATGVTGRGFARGMLPTRGGIATGAGNIRGLASAAFNAGPVAAYTKSVQGAKAAVQAMQIQQMAGGGGTGVIRTMTTAMTGFMKATKLGTIALKLMKVALISTGIGAIMLGIGVAVYIIVKNFDAFKDKASGAILRVKNAWAIFKEAILLLIQPFVDLFSIIGGGSKKGGDAVGGLSKAFEVVGKVLQKVASWFKMLVENFIQPYLYMIIDIVMFVVSIFQGNWGKAFDYLVAATSGAVKIVIKLIAALLKGMVWITAGGIKLIIGYFTLIPKAVAKVFSFLERIPGVGGIFGWIGDSINFVIDGLYGLVDAGKNAASGAIDAVANAATGLLDKGVSKGISSAEGKISNDTKIKDAAEETGEEAGEIMGNSFGDGFEESDATGKIAKAIEEGIVDAIQKLQDYVAGELSNALTKFVDASVKALEKQKTSALKVFDVQIKTLGKLEKAEESLTKKKEYETNRRKIIDNQALSNEQFRRNYALAVYEGRVDDARMLQLQQGADERGFSDDLLTIEQERSKDLAKENLDALKEAIKEAKDAASLFFEESIAKFQESAALITKIAPVTVEQYTAQLQELQTLTETNATNMNTTFGTMFEDFATTIADKMPNKVIGPFATNLDELVLVAKEKFGLGSDKSENTVIGITIGMLAGMGVQFGEGKQLVIDSFGVITSGLAQNFTEMKTQFLDEVKNDFITNFKKALDEAEPTKVFNQAIIDGNLSILRSFQNMVDLNPGLMEKLRKSLDPAINKYLELKAAADAAKDAAAGAADAAAGGPGGGTPGSSTPLNPTGTYAGTGRADAFARNNELRAARNLRALTYQEFIGNYKGFKKGGIIPSRAQNQNQGYPEGFIPAPTQEGVPALLHGGEYILNAKAVQRIGLGALNKMNNNLIPKFLKGGQVPGGKKGTASNTRGSADRIEQKVTNKTSTSPSSLKTPVNLSAIKGVTLKPTTPASPKIPGVATSGNTYSSSELKNLTMRPNTYLVPVPSFTSSGTKQETKEFFKVATRQEALSYSQTKMQNDAKAAKTAEQEKWTTWERFIGQNTVNGVSTIGGPYKQSGIASAIEKFPLAGLLVKDLVVESAKSLGRTFSGSNARQYLNFGSKGPGITGRLLMGAEDILNVIGVAQLTKPLTEPLKMPITAALKKRGLAEASSVWQDATGTSFISQLEGMAGGNTFKGLQTQGRMISQLESGAWDNGLYKLDEFIKEQARIKLMQNTAYETTLAAGITATAPSARNSGLQFLKNTMADYKVAKTLIDSPMSDVSAGINKNVLKSIGGKTAAGVKNVGSVFSNIGSGIKYSKPVQSTLNAASLTLAGLSGRKGLEYGLMATGFKTSPLGISPAQLRDPSWINNLFFPQQGSLFSQARSLPSVLKEVEGQFSNSSILPGSSQTGLIESYMDIINPKSIAGNSGIYNEMRTQIINSGIKSPRLSSDNLYAHGLLRQDLKAMLQTYYGESLYSSLLGGVVTDNEINIRTARIVNNATDEWIGNGYTPSAIGIRGLAFQNYLKEFDSLGLAFNASEMGQTSLSTNLFETLTSPASSQKHLTGSFKDVFRNIQELGKTDRSAAVDQLKALLGSDHDIAFRFNNYNPLSSTSQIPGMGPSISESYPSSLDSPSISPIQRSARQYLLTSNFADIPDFADMVRSATLTNFVPPNPLSPIVPTDLQDYAANMVTGFFPGRGEISPYKSSLYLKSRLKPEYFNQPGGGVIGSTNQLIVFDEIYERLYESYRQGLSRLENIDSDSEAFPFWSPTWGQFNTVWEEYLKDFVEASAAPFTQSGVWMHEFGSVFDALQVAPNIAEMDILSGVRSRMQLAFSGTDLVGDIENLGINYFDRNTGVFGFEDLRSSGASPSNGWFYGLRRGRGIQGASQTVPARTIDELAWEIQNGPSNTFRSTAFSSPPPITSYNQPWVPVSYTDSIRNTLDNIKTTGMLDTLPFNEFKLSDYFATNTADLDTHGGFHFLDAPPSWSYRHEAQIQSLLDNSVSKGFMGGLTPMPDEFTNIVRTILPRQTSSFAPDQLNEFAATVWRDWTKTRGVLFHGSPRVEDFNLLAYTQSPFDSKFYEIFRQSSSIGDLFKGPVAKNELGMSVSNDQITLDSSSKSNRAAYHLAGRMIPEIKKTLVQKKGIGVLDNPILQSLSAIDVLKSRQFAELLQLTSASSISGNALDSIDPNLFEGFPDVYRYLSTGGLFSVELPITPKESEWFYAFADSLLRGPLDLSKTIPLPAEGINNGLYSGLPIPGTPSVFIDPKVAFRSRSVEDWLFDFTRDFDRSSGSGRAAPALRVKMEFLKSLGDYLNNKTVNGYYSDYFQSNPYINDESVTDVLKSINEAANIANAQVSDFPGTMSGGSTRMTSAYQRTLLATQMLQSHKMSSASVLAQYSADVSNYAQAIAEKTLPLAPLFPGRTNQISPFTMNNAYPADILNPYFISQTLTPSRIIEIIGDGILEQGKIGSLMPEDSVLGKIPKQYTKFGKMTIKQYKTGGYVPGAPSTAIPAILHGGEYVINADAVRNMGVRTMQSINQSKFRAPSGAPAYAGGGQTTNVSTVNINVDTFIGEEEWFKGMMKDYNVNVLPRQQKAAGLESRTFTSYNGIQGGF